MEIYDPIDAHAIRERRTQIRRDAFQCVDIGAIRVVEPRRIDHMDMIAIVLEGVYGEIICARSQSMPYLHLSPCTLLDKRAFTRACHSHDQEERDFAGGWLVPREAHEVIQLLLIVIVHCAHVDF